MRRTPGAKGDLPYAALFGAGEGHIVRRLVADAGADRRVEPVMRLQRGGHVVVAGVEEETVEVLLVREQREMRPLARGVGAEDAVGAPALEGGVERRMPPLRDPAGVPEPPGLEGRNVRMH